MNCANDFCIYNKSFECGLDGVNINSLGMCDDCVIVSLDKGYLETVKEKQLLEMKSQ